MGVGGRQQLVSSGYSGGRHTGITEVPGDMNGFRLCLAGRR